MTYVPDEIRAVLTEVEQMTSSERNLFIQLFLKQFRANEVVFFVQRMDRSVGMVKAIRNNGLLKGPGTSIDGSAPHLGPISERKQY